MDKKYRYFKPKDWNKSRSENKTKSIFSTLEAENKNSFEVKRELKREKNNYTLAYMLGSRECPIKIKYSNARKGKEFLKKLMRKNS